MTIHELAAKLSIFGHHDLAEELLRARLNDAGYDELRTASVADVESLQSMLNDAASSWLLATHLAHTSDENGIFFEFASDELRNVIELSAMIKAAGYVPTPVLDPVVVSPEDNGVSLIKAELARSITRFDDTVSPIIARRRDRWNRRLNEIMGIAVSDDAIVAGTIASVVFAAVWGAPKVAEMVTKAVKIASPAFANWIEDRLPEWKLELRFGERGAMKRKIDNEIYRILMSYSKEDIARLDEKFSRLRRRLRI